MFSIESQRSVRATPQRVFDACRSVDVHVQAAAGIAGRAVGGRRSGLSELGESTTWSARFYGVRSRLTTATTHFEAPSALDDSMTWGLFRSFGHRYRIQEDSEQPGVTLLRDTFSFQLPCGVLGDFVGRLVLLPLLTRAQNERMDGIVEWRED